MVLVGLGLKLKHVKGDEVNGKPKQEEEKEMGKGGGAWPEIDQIVRAVHEGEGENDVQAWRSCRDR